MSDMLTAHEVGQRLGLSQRKVYALAASGELTCHRFGSSVRFDPADLEEYKSKCRLPATTRAAGTSSLTASLRDSASALTSYFQKARRGGKRKSSTSEKRNGSGNLQLVASSPNR